MSASFSHYFLLFDCSLYIIVFPFVTELFLIIFVCTFTVRLFFRERISSISFDKEEENRINAGMNVLLRCVAGWSWSPLLVLTAGHRDRLQCAQQQRRQIRQGYGLSSFGCNVIK